MTEVDLDDLAFSVEYVSDGIAFDAAAFVHRATGEIGWYGEAMDDEVRGEAWPSLEEADDSDDYIAVPEKSDLMITGKPLALRFAYQHLSEDDVTEVERYFARKGAFRRFRALLDERDLLTAWNQYEDRILKDALEEWCHEMGLQPVRRSSDAR